MRCAPCHQGTPAFSRKEIVSRLKKIPGWKYKAKQKVLHTEYRMKDFMDAVRFIEKIARIAEKMDHHPDLHLTGYRRLAIDLSTHSIGGISKNDFVLAGKIRKLA